MSRRFVRSFELTRKLSQTTGNSDIMGVPLDAVNRKHCQSEFSHWS